MRFFHKNVLSSSRQLLILVLLLATIGLVTVLAYQAVAAANSHRVTIDGVLRDYAELAAHELGDRTENGLGYYRFATLLVGMVRNDRNFPGPPSADSADWMRRLHSSIRIFFRYDLDSGRFETSAVGSPATVVSALKDAIERHVESYKEDWRYAATFPAAFPKDFVAYSVDSKERKNVVWGFLCSREVISAFLQQTMESAPLLPATLVEKGADNSVMSVSVEAPREDTIFSSEPLIYKREYPLAKSSVRFPGGLSELSATVVMRPEAAAQLIIGGLPQSRLPLLFGLLVLTVGLLVVTIFQFRRERELVRQQADFVAGVSHEFRTPLAQIRMFAETLQLDRIRSEDEKKNSLNIIGQQVERLSHLIENVILFSRSGRRKQAFELKPVELQSLFEELKQSFETISAGSESRLEIRMEPPISVHGDTETIRSILMNFLDNALKYGPRRQTVILEATALGDKVHLAVEDEGEGVSESDSRRIWKPFERLTQHRNSAIAGTGVGLALVRDLVETLDGRVWVEKGTGGGARFVVELKQADPVPAAGRKQEEPGKASRPAGTEV